MLAHNLHNATFFEHRGSGRIAWPSDDSGQVFVTDTTGNLAHTIPRPTADHFPEQYPATAKYAPTDTAYLDGRLWVTDGYGSRFVMAYDLDKKAWTDWIFGGETKKPEPGRFGTPHGISIYSGLLWVSGRFFARIHQVEATADGPVARGMFPLPEGSRPCDFEFFVKDEKLYGVAASLTTRSGSSDAGASIYIIDMESLEVVQRVRLKDDFELPRFDHIHCVLPIMEQGRLTLCCQAWNPGDFAILREPAGTGER